MTTSSFLKRGQVEPNGLSHHLKVSTNEKNTNKEKRGLIAHILLWTVDRKIIAMAPEKMTKINCLFFSHITVLYWEYFVETKKYHIVHVFHWWKLILDENSTQCTCCAIGKRNLSVRNIH